MTTSVADGAAYEQSVSYGTDFAAVYDSLFPLGGDGEAAAGMVTGLVGTDAVAVELGVGNGRVLFPLVARGLRGIGYDASEVMLSRARDNAARLGLDAELVAHDIREPVPAENVDVTLCVGATLAMFPPDQQRAVLRVAAGALRTGGHLVVHSHHRPGIEAMHDDQGRTELEFPRPAGPQVHAESQFDAATGEWWLHHRWAEADGSQGTAREFAFVASPDELEQWARDAGLRVIARHGDWSGRGLLPTDTTAVTVMRLDPEESR